MEKLSTELIKFVDILNQHEWNKQTILIQDINYTGKDELELFFQTLAFEESFMVGGFNITIWALDMIPERQKGWSVFKKDGEWITDYTYWKEEWVIFADMYNYPIFYNRLDGSINGSIDGQLFYKLSPSLTHFITILRLGLELEISYNYETLNENHATSSSFLTDLNNILQDHVEPEYIKGFIDFCFG